MTTTLPMYIFPLFLTVTLWAVLLLLPLPQPQNMFDLRARIVPIVRFFVGLSGSLFVWLVYFIWKANG